MADFTNLLNHSPLDHSDRPQTLEETCRRSAKDLTDTDLLILVKGFREQRERWNQEQIANTHKRVSSKKVQVSAKIPPGLKLRIKKPII